MAYDAEDVRPCAARRHAHLDATLALELDGTDGAGTRAAPHHEALGTPASATLAPNRLREAHSRPFSGEGEARSGVSQVVLSRRPVCSFWRASEEAAIGPADATFVATTVLAPDPATGSPGPGSRSLEIPFPVPSEGATVRVPLATAATFAEACARRLSASRTGTGSSPRLVRGATTSVAIGDDGGRSSGDGEGWSESTDGLTLRFALDEAAGNGCGNGIPEDVRELGARLQRRPHRRPRTSRRARSRSSAWKEFARASGATYLSAMMLWTPPTRTAAVSSAIVATLLGLAVSGCLVDERCYADADCPAGEICSATGSCTFECAEDSDCDADFGVEFVCADQHCVRPAACTTCRFPHAQSSCVHGDCQLVACDPGYYDRDDERANGCEYACPEGSVDANGDPDDGCECTPRGDGTERCNDLDDDCDGAVDEEFDLLRDPAHCGECGRLCPTAPHSTPRCSSGQCRYACDPGFFDGDGLAETGCEVAQCVPAAEVCNGRDDDCDCPGDTNGDGIVCGPDDEGVDEGFDRTTVESCGDYCVACAFAHGTSSCDEGVCHLASCDDGFLDLDGKPSNGCEYRCTPGGEEACNDRDDDCDGLVDEGDVCAPACPPEMVAVGAAYCIDRYEASRPDATATSQGTDGSRAESRAGVLPWMVNPMTSAHFEEFQAACAAAGKRLCTEEEWTAACTGPENHYYVYGNGFDREACNCVDTYCDDYCAEHGLASCTTGADCGYAYDCFHEAPTGSFPGCTNEYGTFDINGNVWEIVPSAADPRGYAVRGGAFNCAGASVRVSCGFNANWTALYAGFRCCRDLD